MDDVELELFSKLCKMFARKRHIEKEDEVFSKYYKAKELINEFLDDDSVIRYKKYVYR